MNTPILQIPLPNQIHRGPRTLIPRRLADVTAILLIEHVQICPVRADIGICPNRQCRGSERAARHCHVDAVGSAVDDGAPGADARGAGC